MKFVFKILLVLSIVSCGQTPTPKSRGYFRIEFPQKEYRVVGAKGLYSFELPRYASLDTKKIYKTLEAKEMYAVGVSLQDSLRAKYQEGESWQNIYFPQQNGQLHLTYFPLKNKGNLAEYLEDTHKFVYKHTIKADDIQLKEYAAPKRKVYGALYDIEGNTASSVQFFVTDSTRHFLRGSLYLNERPNKDSLNVVIDFLREDVVRLMQTLEWK